MIRSASTLTRLSTALLFTLTAYTGLVQAADIVSRPPVGYGFTVRNNANTLDRLRVDESTGTVQIPALTTASSTGMNSLTCFNASGNLGPCAPGAVSGGLSSYAYAYQLATIVDSVVVGGADVPMSNNGPLSTISHTAGTTTVTVASSGVYEVDYSISITAGVGSQLAIAVNGTVNPSTPVAALVATGNITGKALLTLAAGDIVTLRNNSAVPLVMTLAPSVGAQLKLIKLN